MRFVAKIRLFLIVLSSFSFYTGCAGPSGGSMSETEIERLKPIVEKRETILATGYAVIDIQRHDNAAQRRLLAIRTAAFFGRKYSFMSIFCLFLQAENIHLYIDFFRKLPC